MVLPTSYIYYIDNGGLKTFPHFNDGGNELPGNYAQVYLKKTGGLNDKNISVKVFIHNDKGSPIKEFSGANYGFDRKALREVVEQYIKNELNETQMPITAYLRKKVVGKIKSKRKPAKKCKCKK